MKKAKIEKALIRLNEVLKTKNLKGEIGVVGGAAMVLAFDARAATKDVDAIFQPSNELRSAAKIVAKELKLPADWLNDAVKGYMPGNPATKITIFKLDHLFVWVPPAEYLLAMKSISARFDSKDAEDFKLLCQHLKLKNSRQVFKIISKYYPSAQVPAKTKFFVEEIFEKKAW